MSDKIICPDCGGKVRYYHSPDYTNVVCIKKCKGWKVIQQFDRKVKPTIYPKPKNLRIDDRN